MFAIYDTEQDVWAARFPVYWTKDADVAIVVPTREEAEQLIADHGLDETGDVEVREL